MTMSKECIQETVDEACVSVATASGTQYSGAE